MANNKKKSSSSATLGLEQTLWATADKLRHRSLLREFATYLTGNKNLKQFRTKAVRAGLAAAWAKGEYGTIIEVAERLPERVLQEDPESLMYYDNVSLRVGQH